MTDHPTQTKRLPDVPPVRVARILAERAPTGTEKTWYPNGRDERDLYLWEYCHAHEGEPLPLRHAAGFRHVLNRIRIAIHPDELLVGEVGLEDPARCHPHEYRKACLYWRSRDAEQARSADGRFAYTALQHGLIQAGAGRSGHTIPAFDMVLREGLGGLRERALSVAGMQQSPETTSAVYARAMAEALSALSNYVLRHAALARELAAEEANPARQRELAGIADVCDWVAENPPRGLHEALQLLWFSHLGIKLDDGGIGHSMGRFDQYMHPFYAHDLAEGVLTREQAAELVALFWLKLNAEGDDIAHMSLGGQDAGGRDAVNDLTYVCLGVERWVSRKQPNLSTRIHERTSDQYWREIAATIRVGSGHPAVFNDDIIIPGLVEHGIPLEIARCYAQVGCVESYLPGLAAPWIDCYVNIAKCLDLAMNAGRDRHTGIQVGPETPLPERIGSFAELYAAVETQLQHAASTALCFRHMYDAHVSAHAPVPLISAFTPAALERGMDAVDAPPYVLTGIYGVGLGTTVDSLAAIRALVFRQEGIELTDLCRALAVDFRGYETIHAACRHAPKYGNDDDRVDDLACTVISSFGRLVDACPTPSERAIHYGMIGSVVSHAKLGQATGATADGRGAGRSLSDGGSPSQGANTSGATATLRSLTKPDYRAVPGGAAINLRLSFTDAAGEAGINRLAALLKTYFAMGGEQLQVSVTNHAVLREALTNPAAHRDLVVRVAGFTAYFVSLPEILQNEIMARSLIPISSRDIGEQ
ncbi:MAG: hypothetical protein HN742_29855 [Lentisphaerae bacterium]|nr:hypothetical protein [Lentisphaerota bacterium]MBT4817903.1 hypothetical protein [Lentisphaerota bacterium]MBT5608295.1 hypothetical protein [Lentisphaerota bacterium]MBT7061805.1 hypothetical protein [Lentisphaerota bacterium]MBT7846114.1 hypothetical protein [Lentisphaerota bacterium]